MNGMRWIVATSLRYRYLVLFVAVMLVFFGIGQVRTMGSMYSPSSRRRK